VGKEKKDITILRKVETKSRELKRGRGAEKGRYFCRGSLTSWVSETCAGGKGGRGLKKKEIILVTEGQAV